MQNSTMTKDPLEDYKGQVQKLARELYLKQKEIVRDLRESGIREEEKNELKLYLMKMILENFGA